MHLGHGVVQQEGVLISQLTIAAQPDELGKNKRSWHLCPHALYISELTHLKEKAGLLAGGGASFGLAPANPHPPTRACCLVQAGG